MMEEGDKALLPGVSQIGVVVNDVDKTVEFFSSVLGIGPWRTVEVTRTKEQITSGGSPYRVKLAFTTLGPVQVELIQVLEGKTVHSQFLERKGEGLHHLGFYVSNLDEIVAELGRRGIGVLQSVRGPGSGFAYMDTGSVGGVIVELIQRAP
jgi:methylmalonyl-CoA/ethylmalonyl-CoA epimerase